MILDTRLVDAYLNNKSLSDYSGEWIFSDSRRFYYPYCDDKSKAAAAMLYGSVKEQLYDFKPVNSSVYDELFPSWQGETLYSV